MMEVYLLLKAVSRIITSCNSMPHRTRGDERDVNPPVMNLLHETAYPPFLFLRDRYLQFQTLLTMMMMITFIIIVIINIIISALIFSRSCISFSSFSFFFFFLFFFFLNYFLNIHFFLVFEPFSVKFCAKRCTDAPANSVFSGPITHLHSAMPCVSIKSLLHASAKKKTKRL